MKFLKTSVLLAAMAPVAVSASEYPTLETVDYVLTCMKKHGGQTIENLYSCSCTIDQISQMVEFEDFSSANTFRIYKKMPGEKGGLFRDNEQGEQLMASLEDVEKEAEKRCFIRGRSVSKTAE